MFMAGQKVAKKSHVSKGSFFSEAFIAFRNGACLFFTAASGLDLGFSYIF